MGEKEILPERLQYLQPFREFLKKLPKADVGETTDTTLLEELLRKQIHGMSVNEAQERLNSDLDELEKYLSTPRRRNDRLHFVVGFLLIAVEKPEDFLKPPEKPKEILERLTMELPPKAKSSVDQYSLTIKWKRQNFYALRLSMDDEFSHEFTLAKLANPNASEYELLNLVGQTGVAELVPPSARQIRPKNIKVNFGAVTGHKLVASSHSPVVWKSVGYLLSIPGGYVSVDISANHLFDEAEWESYLATLHFLRPSAVGATSL